MEYLKKTLLLFIAITSLSSTVAFLGPFHQTAFAGKCPNEGQLLPGINPWYHGLCNSEGNVELGRNSFSNDIWTIALNVVSIALMLAGYVAVGFVIYGGTQYLISTGDASKVAGAKQTIKNALIGLLIALSANAIVTFIVTEINK